MKHGTKRLHRLQARQRAWDTQRDAQNKTYAEKRGFKRPGSNKKPYPAGKGKTWINP